ncbi:hypothetical protein Tco_0652540 [Tanacetum coccineum]|uniref:Uncharacterized protein n=1 Tax=Tanacetum coccineum TaxID=301880 RepID=A0ABQ4WXX7_9ASTR
MDKGVKMYKELRLTGWCYGFFYVVKVRFFFALHEVVPDTFGLMEVVLLLGKKACSGNICSVDRVRSNMDPLEEYTYNRIWHAFDKCQIGDAVREK